MRRTSLLFSEWIGKQIEPMLPGTKLPSAQSMAESYGISERTIRDVLRAFAGRGKLVLIPGRGTFIPPERIVPPLASKPTSTSSENVAHYLMSEIASGALRNGDPFPTVKYLRARFRVASSTVADACRLLQSRGLAVQVGKGYWVDTPERLVSSRDRRVVWFFKNGPADFGEVFSTDWTAPAYLRMEREFISQGFLVRYGTIDDFKELARTWGVRHDAPPEAMVFHKLRDTLLPELQPSLDLVFALHTKHKTQVLVDWRSGSPALLPKGVKILSRGNAFTTRARCAARFAALGGYREVKLIFDARTYSLDWFLPFVRIMPELGVLDAAIRFTTSVIVDDPNSGVQAFIARLYREREKRFVETIIGKYSPTSISRLEESVELADSVEKTVCRSKNRTLYLFIDDGAALRALDHAASQGLTVPRDLGVMSFGNDSRYCHRSITCCVLDWERAGYLAAHSLIGDIPVGRTTKGFIRLHADILDRGSA